MKAMPLPPIEYLRERLGYDPDSGVLTWKHRPIENFARVRCGKSWNTRYAGRVAGCPHPEVYLYISIDYRRFLAHRIAYAIGHGVDPGDLHIDHRDGNPLNNRLGNLRLATHAENLQHRVGQEARNTSGFRGVVRSGRGWKAQVRHNSKDFYLGTYLTREQAAEVAMEARARLFGKFAGVGEIA